VTAADLLGRFQRLRAVVIGDLMLDEYILGKPTRISPEAPVMVIKHERTWRVPGGAANVARNLKALGAEVQIIGVVGNDQGHALLLDSLNELGSEAARLIIDPTRQTTRKTRILADLSHQVLRVDAEDDHPLSDALEAELRNAALAALETADVVVLSDYLKGTLSEGSAQAVVEAARAKGVPVVANPKPKSLSAYRGATLISLNRTEAAEAVDMRTLSKEEAHAAARQVREAGNHAAVVVTLGHEGMAIAAGQGISIDAPRVEVADPAGAGDTVIATIALGLASASPDEPAVYQLAAQTSAAVVQHAGVAVPSPADLDAIRNR
jgi:rfaE bifunctional protein kinase chain/domain